MLDSTHGISRRLMNLYVTSMPRLWGPWGWLTVIKIMISVNVRSWTLFYVGNCARPSYSFVNRSWGGGGGGYPTKVSNITCVIDETSTTVLEGKHLHKINPPVLCWKCTTKRYFYSHGYYGGYGQIGYTKTFEECGPLWYGLGRSTEVDFKIWGGHQKNSYQCWMFCWLANQ